MTTATETQFQTFDHVHDMIDSIPEGSIVSRTILASPWLRIVLFGFDAGQELTEHKTPMAATIQILDGTGVVMLGDQPQPVEPGALIYMAPNLAHSVRAETPLTMLLTMVKEKSNQ